jgi:MFS family permease
MKTQPTKLKREQKEAISLLSIGTLLEYFDLMIYVHMAIILNELFFPTGDRQVEYLVAAFGFCSTYLIRPLGALLFGYIGDNYGRKSTVVITTFMMATSCLIMATLPTYAQIGIAASILMTFCRILQSLSSMGEVMGASIYLSETIKPPHQYPLVWLAVGFCSAFGGVLALGMATFVTSYSLDWRLAFWAGALIAFIGLVARTKLRETPEFIAARLKAQVKRDNMKNFTEDKTVDLMIETNNSFISRFVATFKKIPLKVCFSLFALQCYFPIIFYFVYMYCGNILKHDFGYTSGEIIYHNFLISLWQSAALLISVFLLYKVHPFKFLRWLLFFGVVAVVVSNYYLSILTSGSQLFWIQVALIICAPHEGAAAPIIYKSFPVLQRFTYVSFIYAMSRAITFVIMAFSLIYIMEAFGTLGLAIITLPIMVAFYFSLRFFENLELARRD